MTPVSLPCTVFPRFSRLTRWFWRMEPGGVHLIDWGRGSASPGLPLRCLHAQVAGLDEQMQWWVHGCLVRKIVLVGQVLVSLPNFEAVSLLSAHPLEDSAGLANVGVAVD